MSPRGRGRWWDGSRDPTAQTASDRRPYRQRHAWRSDRNVGPMSDSNSAVRIVRIDQSHARNAVNSATAARLHDEFVAFNADDGAKVAVLTGDETAFCAGANLRDLPTLRPS